MKNKFEKGFALVTALGLTLVLTAVGAGTLMNSKSETKYSARYIADNVALEAAKSGINTYFSRINDPVLGDEIRAIGRFSATGSSTTSLGSPPAYYFNLSVDSKADIPSDAFIQANAGSFIIYDVTSSGLVKKATWSTNPTVQQVAIWVETYDAGLDINNFPYMKNGISTKHHVTGKADAKQGLSYVVYALGSFGDEREVVRERIAQGSGYIRDLAAVNNAPRYSNNSSLCLDNGDAEGSSGDSSSEDSSSEGITEYRDATSFGKGLIIDSTQSYFTHAIKSNNSVVFPLSENDDEFDYQDSFSSIVAGNMEPLIVYDEGKINKLNYPAVTGSSLTLNNSNTVMSDLFGTNHYIDYFSSTTKGLFYIDAYREASNRISGYPDGEVIGSYAVNVSAGGLGNASALKVANNGYGRIGTLSWDEFTYNVSNAIPMYGIVRVLIPTKLESQSENDSHKNDICGDHNYNRYKPIVRYDSDHDGSYSDISSSGHDDSDSDELSDDASQTQRGKIIVYGSLIFDFFNDDNEDGVYDLSNDTILTYQQAMTVELKINVPVLVNPVADGFTPHNTGITSDYTAVGMYQNGSPSIDMAGDTSTASNGMIDIIAELVGVSENMNSLFYNSGGFQFVDYKSLLSKSSAAYKRKDMFKILDYYHQTRAFSSNANYSHVKLSKIASNKDIFYMDTLSDSSEYTPSAADVFHAFMPTGYIHGWKRAFDVMGLTSAEWNNSLIALDSPFAEKESEIFFLPRELGKDLINTKFKDLPAIMQTAGILALENTLNVSGVVYNPGAIRLGMKESPNVWQAYPAYYLDGWLADKIADCNSNESGSDLIKCIKKANKKYAKKINKINKNIVDIIDKCVGEDPDKKVTVDGNDYYCGSVAKTTSASNITGQYISGATISGFGTFFEKSADGQYIIISYDDVSTDNMPVGHDEMILRRTHWQEVR